MEQVDVTTTKPELLAGAQTGEAGEQHHGSIKRIDRLGQLEDERLTKP